MQREHQQSRYVVQRPHHHCLYLARSHCHVILARVHSCAGNGPGMILITRSSHDNTIMTAWHTVTASTGHTLTGFSAKLGCLRASGPAWACHQAAFRLGPTDPGVGDAYDLPQAVGETATAALTQWRGAHHNSQQKKPHVLQYNAHIRPPPALTCPANTTPPTKLPKHTSVREDRPPVACHNTPY
jgi:hypothetical protein